jgi:putative phosphotransacetylase
MENKVLVETSARHAHVTEATLKILFGEDAKLTVKKDLSQPGQFASGEKIAIVGPKKTIENVSILGPVRKANQVEVSATDARTLGVDIAVRESGDIKGTPGCKLVGPKGEVVISEGVIVAKRHIHATPVEAKALGIEDKQVVNVKVVNDNRSIVYGDVVVRVREDFALAMHIDTDESNAGSVGPNTYGEILK